MQTSPRLDSRPPGYWLTRGRVVLYCSLVLLVDLSLPFIHAYGPYVLHTTRIPAAGWDFAVFWSASHLALHRGATSAFDWMLIEQLALPLQRLASTSMLTPWVYPPTFLLVVWPSALAPFLFSYLAFVLGGLLLAAFACIRTLERHVPPTFWIAAIAFAPVWIIAVTGQNSFLTFALMGLGLAWLDRRPWLAGACFGLLAIKPQLGVLIPVALMCGRQWRTFVSAACTACALCVVAGVALGFDTYASFFDTAARFGRYIADQAPDWPSGMPTVFGAMRHAGVSPAYAYAIHGVVAAIVVVALIVLWLGNARGALRAAVLVMATLLCQPYLVSYDLVWIALPLMLLWKDGERHGWRRGDLPVMVAAWLSPVVFVLPVGWPAGNAVPVVMLALVGVIVRRGIGGCCRASHM